MKKPKIYRIGEYKVTLKKEEKEKEKCGVYIQNHICKQCFFTQIEKIDSDLGHCRVNPCWPCIDLDIPEGYVFEKVSNIEELLEELKK